ncbi:SIR2 family protein [Pelagibaculum spongiae]|uniref:SIR2 family protein n=1 Tax=Pelagibaculum spongiae TaxID=2080658 RepID=A0A2V1H2S7_9GAMM|nr:SIR2 family protein [Pelagibaculum spongiae]PVZ72280.1 SIR2 family protein [Pelagibaculum spongiae]
MDDMSNNELISQLEKNLQCSELSWLLGAGISYDAKLPLMYPLTNRVSNLLKENDLEAFNNCLVPLKSELPDDCHVEHILSHLGDYIALSERSKSKQIKISDNIFTKNELEIIHNKILKIISDTIRSGYVEGKDGNVLEEGSPDNPIVSIDAHNKFIEILFNHQQAGIQDRRKPINLFTTNYDTLIEDALALNRIPCWDGFSGGSVAYRTVAYGDNLPTSGCRANVIKMHGSIDWFLCEKGYVWRVRANDKYPKANKRVLIYPQSTKYIATQQDPFSTQFDLFRNTLNSRSRNVLAVCGYSFGDEHINNEIEVAMSKINNKTVLLAFVECKDLIPMDLEKWRNSSFGKRVFIATINGLYVGAEGPFKRKDDDLWWTFKGLTEILQNGCEV